MGWIFTALSSYAIRETAARKHRSDRRDSDRIRSFHAPGQHGRAHVRISRGIFPWTNPCAATCSRGGLAGGLTQAEVTSCPYSKIVPGMTCHLPDELFLI